jgi:hypothetical protein
MNSVRYRQRRERYSRFQWACRRLCGRAVKWGVFSYAFIAVYGALYGSEPALVHRLGMTLAVVCAGFTGLFIGLFALTGVAAGVDKWRYRHGRVEYG